MLEKVYVIVSYRTYPFVYMYWDEEAGAYAETYSFRHDPPDPVESSPSPAFFLTHADAEAVIRGNAFFEDKLVSILEIFVPQSWVSPDA